MKVKMGQAFDLQMGKTPSRNVAEYWGGEHKWVSIADIGNAGKYISETKECITDEGISGSGIKIVPKGTVIMSFKLSIGKTAIASEDMYTNEAIMAFIDKGVYPVDPNYLYHLCCGTDWTAGTNKAVMGLTLNKATLSDKEINLPTFQEQKEIAEKLDNVDSLINLRQQEHAKLDELVKSRFIELFGTVKDNPYHFPTATLKEVCHKITDGKHGGCEQEADSGYYYVGAREIYDGAIHYETAPQITYADFAKDYRRCNIEQGDMVIVNTGATIGKSAIASSPLTERTLLQKSVALLKVKTDVISAEFLRYCYMANPSMYMVESASAQPNLLLSKMNATVIYLPPIDLQEQFAAFVEQTDKSKLAVKQSLEKLETLKKSLMQQYFG